MPKKERRNLFSLKSVYYYLWVVLVIALIGLGFFLADGIYLKYLDRDKIWSLQEVLNNKSVLFNKEIKLRAVITGPTRGESPKIYIRSSEKNPVTLDICNYGRNIKCYPYDGSTVSGQCYIRREDLGTTFGVRSYELSLEGLEKTFLEFEHILIGELQEKNNISCFEMRKQGFFYANIFDAEGDEPRTILLLSTLMLFLIGVLIFVIRRTLKRTD